MHIIFNFIYVLVILLAFPWLFYKSITTGKYRRGLWAKFTGSAYVRTSDKPCVWFHGVSVGEIHLLRQVVADFRRRYRDWECVISTTTDTGFAEAKRCFPDLTVFCWPLDFTWAVRRALKRVRPSMVVFAESEVWPNFLAAARKQNVQLALINARMSPRTQRRYGNVRWLVQRIFGRFDVIAAQNEDYAAAFRSMGGRHVVVTGSVKYDGVSFDRQQPRTCELRRLFNIRDTDIVLVAGSTQSPEEEIVLGIYRRAKARHANLRLIIVPRQKERFDEVARMLAQAGFPFVRRSELTANASPPHPFPLSPWGRGERGEGGEASVVLVDTFGELSAIWGMADVAFVGGSLDGKRGGQNMIEPAAYGAAVLFGPHTWNFKGTVAQLLRHEAAVRVGNAVELEEQVLRLIEDGRTRNRLGQSAISYVRSQQGATTKTVDALGAAGVHALSRRAA